MPARDIPFNLPETVFFPLYAVMILVVIGLCVWYLRTVFAAPAGVLEPELADWEKDLLLGRPLTAEEEAYMDEVLGDLNMTTDEEEAKEYAAQLAWLEAHPSDLNR